MNPDAPRDFPHGSDRVDGAQLRFCAGERRTPNAPELLRLGGRAALRGRQGERGLPVPGSPSSSSTRRTISASSRARAAAGISVPIVAGHHAGDQRAGHQAMAAQERQPHPRGLPAELDAAVDDDARVHQPRRRPRDGAVRELLAGGRAPDPFFTRTRSPAKRRFSPHWAPRRGLALTSALLRLAARGGGGGCNQRVSAAACGDPLDAPLGSASLRAAVARWRVRAVLGRACGDPRFARLAPRSFGANGLPD